MAASLYGTTIIIRITSISSYISHKLWHYKKAVLAIISKSIYVITASYTHKARLCCRRKAIVFSSERELPTGLNVELIAAL
jgi:hypothetical protein